MEAILSAAEMSTLDRMTIDYYKVPSVVLMERAALSVVSEIEKAELDTTEILVLCGRGNNGGDGFVIARLFAEKGVRSRIFYLPKEGTDLFYGMIPEAELEKDICLEYGIPIETSLNTYGVTLVVDALFGIGLNRPLSETYGEVIDEINGLKEFGVSIVSVDIASGVACDTGKILGNAIEADLTVTFAYKKPGQLLYPGALCTGKLVKKDIGIAKRAVTEIDPECYSIEASDLPCVVRRAYSHKGTYGKALIIAGSEEIGGCTLLATRACFATGAGMVRVFTQAANRDLVLGGCPEAMVDTYGDRFNEEKLLSALSWADVVGIGPGITTGDTASELLSTVLHRSTKPLVIDADAITLLKDYKTELAEDPKRPVIITPHVMEMARFLEIDRAIVLNDLIHVAKKTAKQYHLVCVLKDARTIIAKPSRGYRVNLSGNDGMASAGMGDTLFGIILGLLAQGMDAFDAASFGAFIHGHAADLAVKDLGKSGLSASDVIEYLNDCFE
ncbi:MAG: NAD(P)H-hydrate dehydratase [Lachnospiraceae bacterium]|nr:NAD(P)H-hydrate dehydratase [Lachnospiraceae bacterium]